MSSLIVDRRGVHLALDGNAIVIRESEERLATIPIQPLSRVFLKGDVSVSANLLGKLGEAGVGVIILAGRRGKPALMLARPHNDARRRVAQILKAFDEPFALEFSRALVQRKCEGQRFFLLELRQRYPGVRLELTHAIRQIEKAAVDAQSAQSIAALRGIEGHAARYYFSGLKAVVPDSWGFHGRNRRPPRDPLNALLSLTYTLMHAEIALALFGAGFDPYVGFYHALSFGRESLASDLLEPLRVVCDRFCLELIRNETVRKEHFSQTESGCLLGKAGRQHFYGAYEHAGNDLRSAIAQEVEWLADWLKAAEEPLAAAEEAWEAFASASDSLAASDPLE